jgi:hypothetical protein
MTGAGVGWDGREGLGLGQLGLGESEKNRPTLLILLEASPEFSSNPPSR